MSESTPPRNGPYLRTREFDAHVRTSDERHEDMKQRIERNDTRIDGLERRWDRYVGPVLVFSFALTMVLSATNILVLVGVVG